MSKITIVNNSNVMSDRAAMSSVLHFMEEDQSKFPIVVALTDGSKAIIARKEELRKTKYTLWDMKGGS